MVCVGVFRQAEDAFRGRFVRGASFYLGRISYSVYLFHLMIVMALKPMIASAPLVLQLAIYVALILALSTIFFAGFERPILAARPYYTAARRAAAAALAAPRGEARRFRPSLLSIALGLAALGAGVLARNAFMANKPYAFYGLLFATAGLALALSRKSASCFETGRSPRPREPFSCSRSRCRSPTLSTVTRPDCRSPRPSLSRLIPIAPRRPIRPRSRSGGTIISTSGSGRTASGRRSMRRTRRRSCPFVLVPGSSGRMFDTTIRINNLGFRGPDLPRDKGDAFRIFALGKSQTFGPTLRDGERPWPELLQDLFDQHAECGRRVEVVNAGTEAYTLEDNLERMRRDILPLKPDLILSAHGMNGLLALGLRRVPEPNEPGVRPRASALIGRAVLTIERAAHDWRSRNSAEARPAALAPIPDAELMKSRYAEAYRKLIALARAGGADVALADSSMAINEDSPREVKDFYGAVFKPIDDIVAANAAHNRMVRLLSQEEQVPLIDTAGDLDGQWDDDLYLDIVHFTEAGNERVAGVIFRQLLPILAERDGLAMRAALSGRRRAWRLARLTAILAIAILFGAPALPIASARPNSRDRFRPATGRMRPAG